VRARRFDTDSSAATLAAEIRALAPPPAGVRDAVAEILDDVRARGDEAVEEWSRRFDAGPGARRVDAGELRTALASLDPDVRASLEVAIRNVRRASEADASRNLGGELPEGQSVTLRELPVRRVGVYAPGGRAAYPSTVVMCCVPARVAGVEELVVATPAAPDGSGNATVLAACALCEVDEVLLVGGAQAVAALGYGTETVAPVDVIVGPGSHYVQEAKRQLTGWVGIDGIAGPSELFVVADDDADPHLVALDLAAQAEHGPDTLLVLATPSRELLDAVAAEAEALSERPTVSDAPLALVLTPDLEAALALANAIAPEHLELAVSEPERLVALVRAAGCVFLGRNGGAAFGDYVAGSNHVLPTGGAARFSGPLGASTFRRRQALVSLPDGAAQRLAPHVGNIARAEGFPVHGESAAARNL
jgi:histidinol dehydrogenase